MKALQEFWERRQAGLIPDPLSGEVSQWPGAALHPKLEQSTLIQGDNLEVLQHLLSSGCRGKFDLVYIDPPYATGITFRLDDDRAGTISHSKKGRTAFTDLLTGADFLAFLYPRLILIRELLSFEGSFYFHIDNKAGHYVKILCDEVFGEDNFRNDLARIKCNPKNFARKAYSNQKDVILFYSKSENPIWNEPFTAYSETDLMRLFPKRTSDGRAYTTIPLHAPGETQAGPTSMPFRGIPPPAGRHWRTDVQTLEQWDEQGLIEWSKNGNPRKMLFADEQSGKRVQDIWEFKDPQYPVYPTEKNLDLLRLIIRTSSRPHSWVLDAFCGSGTTLFAAQLEGRYFTGIDQSEEALQVAKKKLSSATDGLFGQQQDWEFWA